MEARNCRLLFSKANLAHDPKKEKFLEKIDQKRKSGDCAEVSSEFPVDGHDVIVNQWYGLVVELSTEDEQKVAVLGVILGISPFFRPPNDFVWVGRGNSVYQGRSPVWLHLLVEEIDVPVALNVLVQLPGSAVTQIDQINLES